MSTTLDICNLALAHLGETPNITDLEEGSAESALCSRFFPMARDALLSMRPWSFASKRSTLAILDLTNGQWAYVYAKPSGSITIYSVIHKDAPDDLLFPTSEANIFTAQQSAVIASAPSGTPFILEALADGTEVLLTNQEDAAALYTYRVANSQVFPPLFVQSLSFLLASYLAGPILKGDVGAKIASEMQKKFSAFYALASLNDGVQHKRTLPHIAPWMAAR